ncbi:MAG: endonuclease [Flavobacteriaceae bacterium]|nr:endonuclease [Flavobacteriaceae bacterium]
MKLKLLSFLLFFSLFVSAQQAYYSDVNLTLTGIPLRDALATKVINTHTKVLDYTPGVWEADRIVDLNPDDPTLSKVLLIYGFDDTDGSVINDRTRDKNNNGGNVGQWNREHVYPQSTGGFDTSPGPGTDVHHVRASDVQFNGQRNNLPFVAGSGNAGAVGGGWYPGDEWKGDVARMIMYMYLRYGNQTLPSNVSIGNVNSIDVNMIDLLLQWNAEDPVSQVEDNRNNYLENASNTYGQGNRNPFIDEPFLATRIWGGPAAEDRWGIFSVAPDSTPPSVPNGLTASNVTATSLSLSWNASTDDTEVTGYEVFQNGSTIGTTPTTSLNVTNLIASTTYTFTVTAFDAENNTSLPSTELQVTTASSGGSGIPDLFFSEYVEGSSNNKALEIANFTGAVVDLSVYTIQKQANGAGVWGSSYSFTTPTLADGSVLVVTNSLSNPTLLGLADETRGGAPLDFNGNDPVGLFKNGVLIDIIGTFNNTANFSINETMRRKPTVTSPNTTFDKIAEWDVFPTDTFDGLGNHTLSTDDFSTTGFKMFPNPVSGGHLFIQTQQLISQVSIYNILGQEVLRFSQPDKDKPLSVNSLKKGIYLAKIALENAQTITRKIIVN